MILFCLSLIVWSLWLFTRVRQNLHLLQLDSYSNPRLIKWLLHDPAKRLVPPKLFGVLFACVLVSGFYGYTLSHIVWILSGLALYWMDRPAPEKKPLVLTSRALRIFALSLLLALALQILLLNFFSQRFDSAGPAFFLSSLASLLLCPLAVIAANILLIPIQQLINWSYLAAAQRKLQTIKPIIVGITGSFGKTSTKYFLETILSERFSVLKTPGSFNTLLGISRVINSDLKPHHKIFIVEIGAYQRGDVMEKCRWVKPRIGLLTTIGPEHFERFKTMENIIATNYELIESLPADGLAVINNDNEYCRPLADKTTHVKLARYGLDRTGAPLRVTAEEISTSAEGLKFTIINEKGERIKTGCRILGRHNVTNILGAASVGLEMGLTLTEVARGISKIQAAPHRLQILSHGTGVTVIDDSYNSNPDGAREALSALAEFQSGKKVLITPGMVELGVLEVEKNREFGSQAASVCDYVILVGPKQTRPIAEGLEAAKFPGDRLKVVKNLAEARQEMEKIVVAGDVVLFENDLPDQYAE